MRATVRKNKQAPFRDERWEVSWDDGPTIQGFPTEQRALGFADVITALKPLDDDISDLKRRADSAESRLAELHREYSD